MPIYEYKCKKCDIRTTERSPEPLTLDEQQELAAKTTPLCVSGTGHELQRVWGLGGFTIH